MERRRDRIGMAPRGPASDCQTQSPDQRAGRECSRHRDGPADAGHPVEVDLGQGEAGAVGRPWRPAMPPGIDDHRVAPAVARGPPSSCRPCWAGASTQHWVSMARARSSGSQWSLPVVEREGRGDAAGSRRRRRPAGGTARRSAGRSRSRGRGGRAASRPPPPSLARLAGRRLAEAHAVGHVDVEEVDLAVGGRGSSPSGAEEDAGVVAARRPRRSAR